MLDHTHRINVYEDRTVKRMLDTSDSSKTRLDASDSKDHLRSRLYHTALPTDTTAAAIQPQVPRVQPTKRDTSQSTLKFISTRSETSYSLQMDTKCLQVEHLHSGRGPKQAALASLPRKGLPLSPMQKLRRRKQAEQEAKKQKEPVCKQNKKQKEPACKQIEKEKEPACKQSKKQKEPACKQIETQIQHPCE
ncbi:histone H1-like [Ranitomeya imitator]|uniref:histone H1-like n=1 Tax=Ranitomeya imitator TaxID=111125 RepID=UPI0037E8BF86